MDVGTTRRAFSHPHVGWEARVVTIILAAQRVATANRAERPSLRHDHHGAVILIPLVVILLVVVVVLLFLLLLGGRLVVQAGGGEVRGAVGEGG